MKKLRVFVSSPHDVSDERKIVSLVVAELSRTLGDILEVQLEAVLWETHSWPDVGKDAQEVINKEIGDYDVFVGVMWKRFGTPTRRAASGTGEEFERAYQYFKKYKRPKIMFYFKRTPFYTDILNEISQFRKVIQFKKKLKKLGTLYWEYQETLEFERRLREHLMRQVHRLTQKPKKVPKAAKAPKIFISYEIEDLEIVEQIYNSLKAAGFEPWLDIKDIVPGQNWRQAIEESILTSNYLLVCISEDSVAKKFIQEKLHIAMSVMKKHPKLSINVIVVRLAPVQLPESLMKFQSFDLYPNDAIDNLIDVIKSHEGK